MKNKYLFDTSFLSSLLNTEDVNHKQALHILMDLPEKFDTVIPATVRLEIAIYKQYRPVFFQVSFKDLFQSLSAELVNIDEKFINNFEEFVASTNFSLKVVDYTVLFSAIITKAELLTFDKKLEKYYKKLQAKISAPRV